MSEPQYLRAGSVNEAIAALKDADGDGLVVAGGIVVGSLFNQRLASPSILVDITRIPGLRNIGREPGGTLRIGALATHDDIQHSAAIKAAAPLLIEIASDIACARLRNRGTLGGNLCTVGGQGDPATGLIALGATMHLRGPAGERTAAIEDFYKSAFEVDLRPDDILEWITVPPMKAGLRYAFCKLGPRNAMDWTQITASVVFDAKDGMLGGIRIGMNGVANTPNRPRGVERLLGQSKLDAIDWAAVGQILNDEISPQGDLVYSENFKRHLAVVALRRALERAAGRPTNAGGQG
jgi:carbon-monoxide dehydrogenase medium subunit